MGTRHRQVEPIKTPDRSPSQEDTGGSHVLATPMLASGSAPVQTGAAIGSKIPAGSRVTAALSQTAGVQSAEFSECTGVIPQQR